MIIIIIYTILSFLLDGLMSNYININLIDPSFFNTFLLNIVIFLLIYLIIKKANLFIPNNILTINIKSLLAISAYHTLSYLILLLSNYQHYPLNILFLILSRSIIMTIIYTTISYLLIKKIYFKIYDKKIK